MTDKKPTPFKGLLYHLRNAHETCRDLDYNFDHKWNWKMTQPRTTMPHDMTLEEIDQCTTENCEIMRILSKCIERIEQQHSTLQNDYYKRLDEFNRNNAKWREVHGLPPLENSE